MPAKLKSTLTELISHNRFQRFFATWKEHIDPSSPLNTTCSQLRADHNDLEDNQITGLLRNEEAQLRRRQLISSLLKLTGKISAEDLQSKQAGQSGNDSPTPVTDPLRKLMEGKLAALQRARVTATDAAEKFKLDIEIQELKDGLDKL